MKKIVVSILIITSLILSGCYYDKEPIKIVVNPWIGYSPLFYLKEEGTLEDLNIKLIHTVSLTNSADFFAENDIDVVAGTQYEFQLTRERGKQIIPFILLDKSFGGDMILSNFTMEEIRNSSEEIDVYLEIKSINKMVLDSFLDSENINPYKINYINIDQSKMRSLDPDSMTRPSLLISYTPYDVQLKKNGFIEIASSRTNENLLIVDALFATNESFEKNIETFKKLKKEIERSKNILKNDPFKYYEMVRYYLEDISYEEFLESLDKIKWLDKNSSEELLKRINKSGINTQRVL